jgi:hypothetical protein
MQIQKKGPKKKNALSMQIQKKDPGRGSLERTANDFIISKET